MKRKHLEIELPATCVWPPSSTNCVWPACGLSFTSAVWEPLTPLPSDIVWLELWPQTKEARPHFLLSFHVDHKSISETDDHCSHQRVWMRAGWNVCFSHVNWIWRRGLPVWDRRFLLLRVSAAVLESYLCAAHHSVQLCNFSVRYLLCL